MNSMAKLCQRNADVREWANAFIDGRMPNLTDDQVADVQLAIDEHVSVRAYEQWIYAVHAD